MNSGEFFVVTAGKKFVRDFIQEAIFLTPSYSMAYKFNSDVNAQEFVFHWMELCPNSKKKFKIWRVDISEVPLEDSLSATFLSEEPKSLEMIVQP